MVTISFEKLDIQVGNKEGDKKVELNPTRQRIIEEMRNNPNITQQQLIDLVGVGKKTIENNISFLKENGYIERIGSNKAGYWNVL